MLKNIIFIVEGKNDINKLKNIYPDIEVIQTGGIRINKNIISTIQLLSLKNDLYIFTDPDYAGKKIRNKLATILNNNCKHIYIQNKKENHKKFGVAEASDDDIKYAINKVFASKDFNNKKINYFSFDEYLKLNLDNKKIRKYIADELKISYFNHKQFYKILNYLNIDLKQLIKYKENYEKRIKNESR